MELAADNNKVDKVKNIGCPHVNIFNEYF